MKAAFRSLVLVAGVLLLSACFKIDMSMSVKSDDTVSGTMIVALDESAAAMMEQSGEGDIFNNTDELPPGAAVEEYAEDGYVGQKATFENVPLDEFNTMFTDDESTFTLAHEGDTFVLTGTFDITGAASSGASDPSLAGAEAMLEEAMKTASMTMSMTFPGEVTDTNGEVDGTTVTWNLAELGDGGELYATALAEGSSGGGDSDGDGSRSDSAAASSDDDSDFPVVPVVIAVVAALVIIGGIIALVRMNKRGAGA